MHKEYQKTNYMFYHHNIFCLTGFGIHHSIIRTIKQMTYPGTNANTIIQTYNNTGVLDDKIHVFSMLKSVNNKFSYTCIYTLWISGMPNLNMSQSSDETLICDKNHLYFWL